MVKNGKRILAVLSLSILTIAIAAIMTGCGGGGEAKYKDSKYLGEWKAVKASYAGIDVDVKTVFAKGFGFTLTEDGTVELSVDGKTEKGKWDETEDGIQFEKDDSFKFKGDGEKLTLSYSGVDVIFEKQK